jgi:hypothetical protein
MNNKDQTRPLSRLIRPSVVGGAFLVALAVIGFAGVVVAADDAGTRADVPTYISSRLGGATAYQQVLLSDGVLNRSEYQAAFESYGTCAEQAGAAIAKPATWSDEVADFELWVEIPGGSSSATIEAGVDRCWRENVGIIQDYWHWQADGHPSDTDLAAEHDEVYRQILECLEASGFDVGKGSPEDLNRAMEQNRPGFMKCVEDAQPTD